MTIRRTRLKFRAFDRSPHAVFTGDPIDGISACKEIWFFAQCLLALLAGHSTLVAQKYLTGTCIHHDELGNSAEPGEMSAGLAEAPHTDDTPFVNNRPGIGRKTGPLDANGFGPFFAGRGTSSAVSN
jgi:hypothetical protein